MIMEWMIMERKISTCKKIKTINLKYLRNVLNVQVKRLFSSIRKRCCVLIVDFHLIKDQNDSMETILKSFLHVDDLLESGDLLLQ